MPFNASIHRLDHSAELKCHCKMAPVALKLTVLLVFVAPSTNPAFPHAEELQRPPWSRTEEYQFVEEQQWPCAEQQQITEEQQILSCLDNRVLLANAMKQAEMQVRSNAITVPFVSIKVEVCQQTATECGSVTVGVGP